MVPSNGWLQREHDAASSFVSAPHSLQYAALLGVRARWAIGTCYEDRGIPDGSFVRVVREDLREMFPARRGFVRLRDRIWFVLAHALHRRNGLEGLHVVPVRPIWCDDNKRFCPVIAAGMTSSEDSEDRSDRIDRTANPFESVIPSSRWGTFKSRHQ